MLTVTPTKILAAQARLLHDQVPKSLIGGLGVAVFFLAIAIGNYSWRAISLWTFLYLAVAAVRLIAYQRIKPHRDDDEKIVVWAKQAPYVLFLPGAVWGAISSSIVFTSDITTTSMIIALLAGLSSGAVGAMAVIHKCYLFYAYPMTIPVVIALLLGPTTTHIYFALPVFLFVLVNIGFSKNIYQVTLNAITTKLNNDLLIAQMEEQQDTLQNQNLEVQSAVLRAEEANRSKSIFLASASHDLAQPLHSMKLFLNALQGEEDPEVQRLLIEKAIQSGDNMSQLFIALLDISKLDAGVLRVENSILDIADILDPLVTEHRAQAEHQELEFVAQITSCVAEADANIIQRIVRNLLHNAFRYTKQGSVSLLTNLDESNRLTISVKDTGIGISEHDIGNIFDEFYQAGNPERDRTRGLGLGLAIVKRLSDLAGLDLEVTSVVGEGTEFKLSLPTYQGDIETSSTQNSPDKQIGSKGSRVLFIDDEADIRLGMKLLLESMDLEAIIAESFDDAMEKLTVSNIVPDLIISDYRLRENRTGVEAIFDLREEFNMQIPALIVTGDTSADSLLEIKNKGIQVIHKLSEQNSIKSSILDALSGS